MIELVACPLVVARVLVKAVGAAVAVAASSARVEAAVPLAVGQELAYS